MGKEIVLGAPYSIIEPLGMLHLSEIAKQEGYIPKIMLVKNGDFSRIHDYIERNNPEFVGYSCFTGNHRDAFGFFDDVRSKHGSKIKTIIGGPHATYFPNECVEHVDYTVVSQGFNALRRILGNRVNPGIVHLQVVEPFPDSDRKTFYKDYEIHRANPIKSIITRTGCPYACTYCFNSSGLITLENALTPQQYSEMKSALGNRNRLFIDMQRPVDDVLREIEMIKKLSPETKMIYFQDDVFGADIDWLKEFVRKYDGSLPFHAQLRFEYANPEKTAGKERLDLLKRANCTGITFAIESADPIVRSEVLNRHMSNDLMINTLKYVGSEKFDFKVRTEQMLGLPLGATTKKTPINLEADLNTLSLNAKLVKESGIPNLAWSSIFVPYDGTRLAKYCLDHGFSSLNMDEVHQSFFEGSILNFPKEWIGPNLSSDNPSFWLSEQEQKQYTDALSDLRATFSTFARIDDGDELARDFLTKDDRSFSAFNGFISQKTGQPVFNHFTRGDELARDFSRSSDKSLQTWDKVLKNHLFDRVIYGVA